MNNKKMKLNEARKINSIKEMMDLAVKESGDQIAFQYKDEIEKDKIQHLPNLFVRLAFIASRLYAFALVLGRIDFVKNAKRFPPQQPFRLSSRLALGMEVGQYSNGCKKLPRKPYSSRATENDLYRGNVALFGALRGGEFLHYYNRTAYGGVRLRDVRL